MCVLVGMSEEEPVDKKPEIEEACKPHCSYVRNFALENLFNDLFLLGVGRISSLCQENRK